MLIEVPHWWDGTKESLAATIRSVRSDLIPNTPSVDQIPISSLQQLSSSDNSDPHLSVEASSHKEVFEQLAQSLNLQSPLDWCNIDKETLQRQSGFRSILKKYYGNSLYKVHLLLLALLLF